MELKTKIDAENGKQEMVITREFNLPVNLLFKAFSEPELIEEWMGTKVLMFEGKKYGGYQIETKDHKGNVAFKASGTFHEFKPDQKITRTFEMDGTPFGVQLEICQFEPLTDNTCKLNMHVIYESANQRDEVLKLPFAQGINWAHTRLEEIMSKLK